MALTWEMVLNPTYNEVTPGSVTPTSGASIAASSTGQMRSTEVQTPSASTVTGGITGNPGVGLLVFAVLIGLLMFVVHRFGGEDSDFSNVRASTYNILLVSLIAAAGIPLWRYGSARLATTGLPGADHVASYIAGS